MSGFHRILEAITQKTDDLFVVGLDGIEVVFRLPSIKEGQQYVMSLEACETVSERSEVYESLFRYIVEDEWLASKSSDIPAGVPETIGKLAIMLSGLDEHSIEYTEQLFNLYRKQSNSTIMYMQRMICKVFPGYKFEDLDLLNYQKLVNVFIQAEQVLLNPSIITEEHNFNSPEKSKPKPFRVEDVIRDDGKAYSEYDNKDKKDAAIKHKTQNVREEAIKRARETEQQYRQQLARRLQKK